MQYTEAQKREAGKMNLKIHSKTNPNSRQRGVKGRKEERANGGEEKSALVFKTISVQSVTMTFTLKKITMPLSLMTILLMCIPTWLIHTSFDIILILTYFNNLF